MNNEGKFLTIGSIVRLKGAPGLLMITGYLVELEGKTYDYMGYTSNESKNFNTKLENIRKNLNK